MSEKSAKGKNARRKGKGEFFAVDRRSWGAVCGLSAEDAPTENIAAAYLVLACFSDGANATSTAATHAVEKHTGISRGRASLAIKALVAGGAVEALHVEDRAKAGPSVPRYRLRPWSEFRAVLAQHYGKELGAFKGRPSVNEGFRRRPPSALEDRIYFAERLVRAGLAVPQKRNDERAEHWTLEVEPEGDGSPDWVWLPNSLVRGTRNETAPVERARRTTNTDNLRTLVELYAEHDLSEDGGVSRETWRVPFERVGPYILQGRCAVYGFCPVSKVCSSWGARLFRALGEDRFWAAIDWVQRAGLASRVVFVAESNDVRAQILYPLAAVDVLPSGAPSYSPKADEGPRALRREMQDALRRIDPEGRHARGLEASRAQASADRKTTLTIDHVVLVDASFTAVALVGVLRLRYRPRTAKTSRWFGLEGRSLARALHDLQRLGRTPAELAALDAEANDNGAEGPQRNTYNKAVS